MELKQINTSGTALPACFGHRGACNLASAGYPENTMAAFKGAILDGSEGIESGELISASPIISQLRPTIDVHIWYA
ncbi:hypothetical protein E3Q16_03316 [Wallemia mellicola]|uniref:Uncharacterized protein n=1 Tax=Wallemia mellicola TaxID=1708541 RepID=A0AB74KAL9_9BASI|nr:hypothetical protein E3Q24_03147 [Wallemia mellicola]TIB84090.1 hypothetical protein E3Q21_02602 [Wallemia mellicola]TIB87177.1 hypothetical protein E3Q20_02595 [Wallemia mellicola]TIC02833.1 hypothetical protein E3Q16_03316 [Wallemia mellicola]TIC21722.1 hypothetical protein E3Q12_03190 [Wallemia mellicola]